MAAGMSCSQASLEASTSSLWLAGNSDSSPSRQDQASKSSAAQQAVEAAIDMVEAEGAEADVAAAEPAATASGTLADKMPLRTAAGEDAMQTPKRATSRSAFSVFMTPKGSGQHLAIVAIMATLTQISSPGLSLHSVLKAEPCPNPVPFCQCMSFTA